MIIYIIHLSFFIFFVHLFFVPRTPPGLYPASCSADARRLIGTAGVLFRERPYVVDWYRRRSITRAPVG